MRSWLESDVVTERVVEPRHVEIEDHSGRAGGKAYKLVNKIDPRAQAAALHVLPPPLCPAPGSLLGVQECRLRVGDGDSPETLI